MKYNLADIAAQREGQKSFHVVSEKSLRVEYVRLAPEERYGPLNYDGDVLVTSITGRIDCGEERLSELEQVVVPEGKTLQILAVGEAVVQLVWSPPFARARSDG